MVEVESIQDLQLIKGMVRKSLAQLVYETLRRAILRGDIPPGERLVEERLARAMGASRTPVREALRRLEQEGLLQRGPKGGYEVLRHTIRDIREIFEIRSILESHAAALATRHMDQQSLDTLERIIASSQKALDMGDIEEFISLNTEFHDNLYKASQSTRLYKMINDLRDYFYRYRKIILRVEGMPRVSLADHRMMMEAMRKGEEARVERLVREHILRGMDVVVGEIEAGRLSL